MPLSKKVVLGVLTGLMAALIWGVCFYPNRSETPVRKGGKVLEKSSRPSAQPIAFEQHPLAVELTAGLNQPEKSAQDDLQVLVQILYTFRQSLKENPIGQNDDITAALLGANDKHILFLSEEGAPIRDGKLVDRWGTPYWFHPLSGQKMELRSAGPDREMFTPDDILLE